MTRYRFATGSLPNNYFIYIYIYITESMFVALLYVMFLGMYTINCLTRQPIPTKSGLLTNQNTTKKVGYKIILIFASIGVSLNIIVSYYYSYASPVARQRWCFLWGQFVLCTLLWERSNKGVMRSFVGSVARQRPVSNNREVFSLRSVPRTCCNGKIVCLGV
jgi:hypothetical protein